MLSSGCQAHRMEAWGERKTRGVTTAGWSEGGGLCVDSMRLPPANRILDMFIETHQQNRAGVYSRTSRVFLA